MRALLFWVIVYWPVLVMLSAFLFPRLFRRLAGWNAERSLLERYGPARQEARLTELGRSLAAAAGISGAEFQLLPGNDLNAVALPHGKIYVWMGLYRLVQNHPDKLAGVLAHELGHLECNHFLRRVRFAYVLQTAFFWIGRGWFSQLAQRIGGAIITSGFSRAQEREADLVAVRILEMSGRSAAGMADLLDHLGSSEGSAPLGAPFLDTHPGCRERATVIRARMK